VDQRRAADDLGDEARHAVVGRPGVDEGVGPVDAAGVGEQVADRDLPGGLRRVEPEVVQVVGHRIVEADLAPLHVLEHQRAGHDLGHRPDLVQRLGIGVGRPDLDLLARADGHHRPRRPVSPDRPGHHLVERPHGPHVRASAAEPVVSDGGSPRCSPSITPSI
jgi:hypothetical protein